MSVNRLLGRGKDSGEPLNFVHNGEADEQPGAILSAAWVQCFRVFGPKDPHSRGPAPL